MSCELEPRALHTVVPDKGEPGDSSGYLVFAPNAGEPLTWRYRFPYRGILSLIDRDGVPAEGVRIRAAATGLLLQEEAFVPFSGGREFDVRTTVEFELLADGPGATVLMRYEKLKPVI